MDEYNVDFHLHSKYSGGSSEAMVLPEIARQAQLKGLHIVGTSDATHPMWLKHMKANLIEEGDGVYSIRGFKTRFIATTEIEDASRVHHVIIFPDINAAEQFRAEIKPHSVDIDSDGRPHVRLNGEQLAERAEAVSGLIGPSHAFTPWTAVYKEYDSLKECYGVNLKKVGFLELGLSADTDMADRIAELKDVTFLSNSDCHSPMPHRLGREFNRLLLDAPAFGEIKKAIQRIGGRRFVLNVGLNPREGKYHLTACSRCFLKFKIEEAVKLKYRCPECRGIIKKGVLDRINELASTPKPAHPPHRPPYMHALPLAEVIALSYGVKTVTSGRIQAQWKKLVDAFESEINVLVDAPIIEVKKIDPGAGSIIEKLRSGRLQYVAGGGGQYGRPTLSGERDVYYGSGQRPLSDF
jgi:uncharacterized protein (TIGR00375 family)